MPSATPLRVTMVVEQLWQAVPGGSGTYIIELATELAKRPTIIELSGYVARHPFAEVLATDHGLPPSMPISVGTLPRRALYELWSWHLPLVRRRPAVNLSSDVIHATTWAIPPKSAPLVVTIHDLAFRRRPEFFTQRGVRFFERMVAITRREANVIIVPSQATARDCAAAGFVTERIRVIPHGVRPQAIPAARRLEFREKYGISRPFVLWVGTLEPRKNLPTVLAAYREAMQSQPELDLVLVGPAGWGGASDQAQQIAATLPPDKVHILGRVSDADLQAAYATAAVFCFPAFWEGFGLPVLEAQAHGTPVVTSRNTSMAEVCGAGAILVNPESAGEVAEGILACLGSDRIRLAEAALANSRQYTWEKSATQHIAAYQEAAHG